MDDSAVIFRNVSKRYGSGHQAVAALDNLSLEIASGDFVSVMGHSGSGKTTMLNLIAGLDTPTEGAIVVNGRDLAQLSDDERSDLRLKQVGFVFQAFNLIPTFSVEENVAWPLEYLGRSTPAALERAREVLDIVGIGSATWRRRPAQLASGEQQRVAIARALAPEPTLLLADEPTGNLDSRTGQAILDLLRDTNARRHLTVVLVTHSRFAATYGHRTVELRDGRIVRDVHLGAGSEALSKA
jgi:putative ABC transport system ATP-binding protein